MFCILFMQVNDSFVVLSAIPDIFLSLASSFSLFLSDRSRRFIVRTGENAPPRVITRIVPVGGNNGSVANVVENDEAAGYDRG